MPVNRLPKIAFNAQLMETDRAKKGWSVEELARRAKVSRAAAYNFLNGSSRAIGMNAKLAKALKRNPARYVLEG